MSQEAAIALKEWALAIPVMVLLLAPGLGPAWVFGRRRELSLPWILSLAFAWGVAWCSALAIAAFVLHLSLSVVIGGYLAAIPFSIWVFVVDFKKRGRPKRIDAGLQGLAVAFIAWLTALIQGPPWYGSDNFFHLAAARSVIATGRPIVTDPFYGLESNIPDSTAGMWNTVMAVISEIVATDVATVYAALTAFAAFAVMLAFWVLAREFSQSARAATVVSLAYLVAAWYTDFRPFGYPNKVSIALAFTTLALFVRLATEPERHWMVAAGVTGLSGLAVHLASGQMELLCAAGMALSLGVLSLVRKPAEERRAGRRAVAHIAGGIGLMVLPVSPTLVARVIALADSPVMGENSFIWAGDQIVRGPWGIRMVTPGGFDFGGPWLFWITLAIAALAVVYAIKTGDRRAAALVPVVLVSHVLSAFPPVSTLLLNMSSYMVARMAELFRFAPYLAIAWGIGMLEPGRMRTAARVLGYAMLVAALVTSVPYIVSTYAQGKGTVRRGSIWSISETWKRDTRKLYGFSEIFEMRRIVGDSYPRVAADDDTGYHLMGLLPVSVIASLGSHTPVLLPREEVDARNEDMVRFFAPTTSREERARILKDRDVDYVFVREYINGVDTRNALLKDTELFERLVGNDRIIFLRVNKDALERITEGRD